MRRRLGRHVVVIACASALAACGGDGPDLASFESSSEPYFYAGRSFDGLDLTHVEPYETGVGFLIYGTCAASSDTGCAPPLELQHRMCGNRLTVVIFVGTDPKPGRPARAAKALVPISRGAKGVRPRLAFGNSPPCWARARTSPS